MRGGAPWLLAATFFLALAGCGGPAAEPEPEPADPPDQTYTLRGEVVGLPRPDDPERQLRLRHEAVPDFVDFEGEVVGMASMTMPFPVAGKVDLDGIEEGDKVETTFEIRWEGTPPLRIVALRELPAGTELDFTSSEPMPGEAAVEGTGSAPP